MKLILTSTPQIPVVGLRLAKIVFHSRRRIATALAIVCVLLLGYHVIFGQNGLTIYQEKRNEHKALSKQIQELQQENARLRAHTKRLQGDSDAIEHEARERLHYARPGEVIYTLDDKPKPPSQPHPSGN